MGKDLQLLRDVDTQWSSALLMIEHALILEEVSLGVTRNLCYKINFDIWICSALSLSSVCRNSKISEINTAL